MVKVIRHCDQKRGCYTPLITAITPVYEGTNLEWLNERNKSLRGLVQFAYAGDRATLDRIQKLHPASDPTLFVELDTRNVAKKRNTLLAMIRTPFVMAADDDDRWITEVLYQYQEDLRTHTNIGGRFGVTQTISPEGEPGFIVPVPNRLITGKQIFTEWMETRSEEEPHGCIIVHPSSGILRTTTLRRAGGWAEGVNDGRWGEDLIMLVAAANVQPFRISSELVMEYRIHPSSLSHQVGEPGGPRSDAAEQKFVDVMRAVAEGTLTASTALLQT